MRTQQELDADMLNATKDLTEVLFRRGHLNDQEVGEAQERRQKVGARSLTIHRDDVEREY